VTSSRGAGALELPGCHLLESPVLSDARGRFAKPFAAPAFAAAGLRHDWAECFWSESSLGAVRGFHAQLPPSAHVKLVWAMAGASHSVLLDLRDGSPTFRKTVSVRLDARSSRALYVAEGVAHAFQALEAGTILGYLVTSAHDAARDSGVRWDSAGVSWPIPVGEVSERDRTLPALADFKTPFRFAK
jgi:dTDP-4-dehydrorhamnose 3,5-epimerase